MSSTATRLNDRERAPGLTYRVFRSFQESRRPKVIIHTGLTIAEAQAHCNDPETSSRTATGKEARRRTRECGPWFDGYEAEVE